MSEPLTFEERLASAEKNISTLTEITGRQNEVLKSHNDSIALLNKTNASLMEAMKLLAAK